MPLYWDVVTSFKTYKQILEKFPLLPSFPLTLMNYAEIFISPGISLGSYLMNSIVISIATTAISLFIGLLAAYGLARFRFAGRGPIAFAILLIRMIPFIAIAIPIYVMMRKLSLTNTRTALVITYTVFNLPFIIWVMRSFIEEIPPDTEESAQIDGCSRIGAFYRILIPQIAPGLVATAVFTLLLSWNEFLFALVLTRTPAAQTATVFLGSQITYERVFWGRIAAIATILCVPPVIFFILTQKKLVRGLTFGAVKG